VTVFVLKISNGHHRRRVSRLDDEECGEQHRGCDEEADGARA
jgi:hypothetical protein